MSKVDALRALREARYAAQFARPPSGKATTTAVTDVKAPAAKPSGAVPKGAAKAARSAAAPATGLDIEAEVDACGHRSMNGRLCTRPGGHTEKNHRYG